MLCPNCGEDGFTKYKGHKKCGLEGTDAQENSQYPTKTGRTDTIILRDCDFYTGTWKCQWRQWASDRETKAYCDFHVIILQEIDRHGDDQRRAANQWEQFCQERLWALKSGRQYAYPRDFGGEVQPNFWHRPIDESWHMVTGLPLPVGTEGLDSEQKQKAHDPIRTMPPFGGRGFDDHAAKKSPAIGQG